MLRRRRGVAEVVAVLPAGVAEAAQRGRTAVCSAAECGYEGALCAAVARDAGAVHDAGDGDGGGRVTGHELAAAAGERYKEGDVLVDLFQAAIVAAVEQRGGYVRSCHTVAKFLTNNKQTTERFPTQRKKILTCGGSHVPVQRQENILLG